MDPAHSLLHTPAQGTWHTLHAPSSQGDCQELIRRLRECPERTAQAIFALQQLASAFPMCFLRWWHTRHHGKRVLRRAWMIFFPTGHLRSPSWGDLRLKLWRLRPPAFPLPYSFFFSPLNSTGPSDSFSAVSGLMGETNGGSAVSRGPDWHTANPTYWGFQHPNSARYAAPDLETSMDTAAVCPEGSYALMPYCS